MMNIGKVFVEALKSFAAYRPANPQLDDAQKLPENVMRLREVVLREKETALGSVRFDNNATPEKLDKAVAALSARYDSQYLSDAVNTLLSLFRDQKNDPDVMTYALNAFRKVGDATPDRHLAADLCIAAACLVPQDSALETAIAHEWDMCCGHLHAGIAMRAAQSDQRFRQKHPQPRYDF